jgi:T-complex protein 1 subunit beta
LRQAEQLLLQQRIHPQTVCEGWRLALAASRTVLAYASMDILLKTTDSTTTTTSTSNIDTYWNDLLEIAKTTLSSKFLTHEKEHFALLAVNAVLRLKDTNNLDYIQIIKNKVGRYVICI